MMFVNLPEVGIVEYKIYRKLPCGKNNPQYQVFRRKRRQRWLNKYIAEAMAEQWG